MALSLQAGPFVREVVTSCSLRRSLLFKLPVIVATYALSAGAEEPFHTVQVSVLRILRSRLLVRIHFTLVLQVAAVISKSGLPVLLLQRLHLAFKRVVDALPLVHRVVQAFRAGD